MAVLPSITLRIRRRWWLGLYLYTLVLFCELFDTKPNWDRVEWWLVRGIKVEMWSGSRWRRIP